MARRGVVGGVLAGSSAEVTLRCAAESRMWCRTPERITAQLASPANRRPASLQEKSVSSHGLLMARQVSQALERLAEEEEGRKRPRLQATNVREDHEAV